MTPIQSSARAARAFTLIELLVVVSIIAVLIAILVPGLAGARKYARKAKDSTHIRAIVQGMTTWASQHDGAAPRPSALDRDDRTMKVPGQAPIAKDNTGNILSVLIFNGLLETEQTISPAENNDQIEQDEGYQRDSVSRAATHELALWDPGFAGIPGEHDSFTGVGTQGRRKSGGGAEVGHNSYALAFPFGERAAAWGSGFSARTVMAGNRGPRYRFKDGDVWSLEDTKLSGRSNTLRFYGREDAWSGHLAYGDGSVSFSETPTPEGLRVAPPGATGSAESSFLDNVFVNEVESGAQLGTFNSTLDTRPDQGVNAFIRLWGNVRSQIGSGEAVLEAVGNDGAQGNFID
jgi:prepilin-type N-terminal cleavage/methylation domain-containing protein